MRRILIGIVSLIVLVIGLLQFRTGITELFPSLTQDGQVRAAATDAVKAAGEFSALAKDSAQTGNAPRQSDPAVKPLLDRVFTTDLLASKTLTKSDLGSASDWNISVVKAGLVYIFAGTGVTDPSKVPSDPKIGEKVNQNLVTFAPEIGRYLDAQLAVLGATVDAVNASVGDGKPSNAQVESGLAQVRGGLTSTLTGVLSTLATDGLDDGWRRARLPALDVIAPKAGKLLLPDQCRTVRDTASQAADAIHDATTQERLKGFAQALGCAA